MKKIRNYLPFILFLIVTMMACSEAKVPEKAIASFDEMFPGAKDVDWELEDNGRWEVEFKFKGNNFEAGFTKDGDWIETEREVDIATVPKQVLTSIKTKYTDWTIKEVEFITNTELNGYEFNLAKDNKKMEVIVTVEGEIVNVVTDQDNDDD